MGRAHRGTAVSMPAADGLFGQRGSLGEYRSASQSVKFFAGAGGKQNARIANGCGSAARTGCWRRSEGSAAARGENFPGRAGGADDSGNTGEATRQPAGDAGEAGRSGEAGGSGNGRRAGFGSPGVSAEIESRQSAVDSS